MRPSSRRPSVGRTGGGSPLNRPIRSVRRGEGGADGGFRQGEQGGPRRLWKIRPKGGQLGMRRIKVLRMYCARRRNLRFKGDSAVFPLARIPLSALSAGSAAAKLRPLEGTAEARSHAAEVPPPRPAAEGSPLPCRPRRGGKRRERALPASPWFSLPAFGFFQRRSRATLVVRVDSVPRPRASEGNDSPRRAAAAGIHRSRTLAQPKSPSCVRWRRPRTRRT